MSIADKRAYDKKQRQLWLDAEYKKLIDNAVGKVQERYRKKKQARWNRIERDFDRKTRKLVLLENSKEKLKTTTSIKAIEKIKERIDKVNSKDVSKKPNYKQLAFKYFQLYIRLKYARKWDGMVWLIYEKKWVYYKNCNAWHYFSKQKRGHMVFLEDNCMPIQSDTNRRQWPYEWDFWANALIENIWMVRYLELKQIAGDTIEKNKIRKMDYYKWEYEKWREKCEQLALEKWFTL